MGRQRRIVNNHVCQKGEGGEEEEEAARRARVSDDKLTPHSSHWLRRRAQQVDFVEQGGRICTACRHMQSVAQEGHEGAARERESNASFIYIRMCIAIFAGFRLHPPLQQI